ncbi:CatB-related O-acetyltransferase [Campylobacter concisus]|uniref:Chloramphenicol acetyltransferase n=1 Tax=Campylobacter concisus UNSW2 TaxID=1242965 RepID=U2GXA2_9BACT|nr:CatB-related O-acetyltransferase [Campylobacter concisus]ERJ32739.1 Acetyltransferase (isoleucine patch superfamily)-like protein [Campylobacter concisus UNSW2]
MENKISDNVTVAKTAVVIDSTLSFFSRLKDYVEFRNSFLGAYSYVSQYTIVNKTNIGKFTSISSGCYIGLWEHNMQVSTHSFYLYEHSGQFVKGYRNYDKDDLETNIGNDVWIGANSVILKGVNVADGAIVGAGAVVTKDVPEYGIVVGNPAKLLKFRYLKEDIDFMIRTKWWDFDRKKIQDLVDQKAFDDFEKFKKIVSDNL